MTENSLLLQQRRATRIEAEPEVIDPRAEPMAALPLMGRVSAGQPLEAIEDSEWVEVPARLTRIARFALRVRGDSMTDDQIEDGDLILVAPRVTPEDGETVVALIGGGDATLKRIYRTPGGIRLQPANPDYAPLELARGEVEVIGVVTAVVREVR